MTALLSPKAEHTQPWRLDLHHKTYARGDVVMVLTWNFITSEPAMVLIHKKRLAGFNRDTPFVIPLSSTVIYAEGFENDAEAMQRCVLACYNLDIDPSYKAVIRLMSFIRDHIGEMLAIPPMPDTREVVAEMLIMNNRTGKESYREVRDNA